MSWLTNPYRFGDGFATEEWVVFNDATSNRLRYWKINPAAGTFTALTDIAMPNSGQFGIATNQTFVFVGNGTACAQYAWNGSTLTQRHSADPGAATSNNFNYDFYFVPGNAGRIMSSGVGDFAEGVQTWAFQSAPAYSYGTPTNYDPAGGFSQFIDFRVGAVGQQGYGNTFVCLNYNTGQALYSMTASGTAITGHSNVTLASGGYFGGGADRDTGLIVSRGSNAALIYMAQMNMSSRALSSIGNGSITGTSVYAVAALKGFVVTYENTGKVRSYSRSGSTLTLVNTLDLGGSPAAAHLHVSPYTRLLYLISISGSSRVIECSAAGVLTSKVTLTGVTVNGGGWTGTPIAFLPAALPTV